jgi:hypothetical protein
VRISGSLGAVVIRVMNAQRCALAMTWLLLAVQACGCASESAARKPAPKPQVVAPVIAPAEAPVAEPAPPPAVPKSVRIRGLTGTLNKDDVHQTMEARQNELEACIQESRRRLRLVSGKIQFSFKVDAEGAVEDVHPTESNIGHYALESCILRVLSETVFPKPDGDASARFEWGLTVEPATARAPEAIEADVLEKVLDKHGSELREACETKKRERFTVTAYINRKGKVVSAGALAEPAEAAEKLECVLDGIKHLRMPKQKKDAKVTFVLR